MKIQMLAVCIALAGCNAENSAPEQTGSTEASTEAITEASTEVDRTESQSSDFSNNPVAACISRGIAYFKMIGSYPTLKSAPNTGRDADEVAAERCARTTTAFP